MGAIDNLLKTTQDEEKKKEGVTITSSRTEQPTPQSGGSAIDKLLSQTKQQTRTEQKPVTVEAPKVEEPKKGFLGSAIDAGKKATKFGLDVLNVISSTYDKAINLAAKPLANTQFIQEAAAGIDAVSSGQVKGSTFDLFGEELLKGLKEPVLTVLNTDTGKKTISTISEKSSNIPLKTFARIQSLGDQTYDEAYKAWLAERNDPENPTWQKFLYELQDTGIQTGIGVLLSVGTTYATRNPQAGLVVSGAYYTALSADEQLQQKGQVYSTTNIAIDVVGDQMLGKVLEGILGSATKSTLTSALKGFGVEGSTEVAQSLLKYSNDYANARTPEEKQAVLNEAKLYVTSGGMAMEFFVGGVAGAAITGAGSAIDALINPSAQPNTATTKGGGANVEEAPTEKVPNTSKVNAAVDGLDVSEARDKFVEFQKTFDVNDPSDTDIAARLGDILNDYTTAFNDKTVYIPSDTNDAPLVDITTSTFPDGKVVVKFAANTETNGLSSTFDYSQKFATKEEATKSAQDAILAWARSQEAANPEEAAQYQKIIDYTTNPRAPLSDEARVAEPLTQQKMTLSQAKKLIPKEGGFANLKSPVARNAYAAEQLAGSFQLNEKFLFDNAQAQGVDLTSELQKIDALPDAGARTQAATDLVSRLTDGQKTEKKKTQKEVVEEAVKDKPKTIQEIAEETGILEPNVRRILGVGAKEGTFIRIEKGVYVLSKDGVDTAYIYPEDAIETLPKLAEEGFKADMVFLDIPYDTPAVRGGNRGVKYDLISVPQFKTLVDAVSKITRTNDTPVFHMFSQAKSGLSKMEQYNKVLVDAGFVPVARGEYTKLQLDGVTRVRNMRGAVIEPEGLILFTKSGKFDKENPNLNFKLIRPKGYQTEKPAEMLKALIEMSTKEGDIVLDPFAGSGVTGAEAVKAGRKAVLVEKNKEVVEKVTAPRVEQALKETEAKPQEVIKTIDKSNEANYIDAVELSKLSKKQISDNIHTGLNIGDKNGEYIAKFATPTANSGFALDLFKTRANLMDFRDAGVFTDTYTLINDKKVVAELYDTIYKKIPSYKTYKSPKDAQVPQWQTIVSDKREPATIQGYVASKEAITKSGLLAILSNGEYQQAVDPDKLAFVMSKFPDAKIYFTGNQRPVVFEQNGNIKALVMPYAKVPVESKFDVSTTKKQEFKAPSGRGNASAGIWENGEALLTDEAREKAKVPKKQTVNVEMGGLEYINPIELPELVDLARDLMGNVPSVVKKTGNASGRFYGELNGRIKLIAELFKKGGNHLEAARTLAHEIGHLIDYLPDRTLNRGNMLGRLGTLRNFMAQTFSFETGTSLPKEAREAIRKEARAEVAEALGKKQKDFTEADKKQVTKIYKQRLNEAIKTGGYILDENVRKELLTITRWWHPYDPATVPASYKAYRESAVELYAEAISVLFNAPKRLQEMAPTFYNNFFQSLDNKPDVKEAYFDLQAVLSGDRELLLKRRREGIKKMFKDGDYKAIELHNRRVAEKEERRKQYWSHFKHTVIDKNFQIIDRVKNVERSGKRINPDENPVYFLEERNYIGGKIKAVFEREFNTIYSTLNENQISWDDFGETLFYARIAAGDRSEVANPRGITPDAAKELVAKVAEPYTAEQRKILSEQVEKFHNAIKSVNDEAYQAGLYKPELYQQMLENPAYVTFQVLDHLEDGMTSRIYKSLGTLKDIANPADATMLKVISTIRATERNKTTKATVEFLLKEFSGEIEEAKYIGSKKGRSPIPSRKPNQELVTFFDQGKVKGYYVDPYIAETINNQSVGQNAPIVPVIRFMNSKLFRPLFISFNLGFQSFNLIRDFVRFYKNIPDMTLPRAIKRYAEAGRISRIRAFGLPKNPTAADIEASNLLNRLEEEKVLSVTYNDLINGSTEVDKQVEKILADTGIKDFQPKPTIEKVPKFAKPAVKALDKAGVLDIASNILGFIENLGNLIETLPKAAGVYEYTSQSEDGWLSREQKSYIRRKLGSPDFLAGGTYKPITNEVFLFSNAIIQGMRSDLEIATDPQTRSAWWWKTAKVQFLPKILMAAVLMGAFGDDYKELMEGVSEYDRTNYIVIPFGKDENGKTIYFRVPVDETSRFLGGVFWKALTAASNENSIGSDIMDIASYTGGQLPSISPTIQSFSATLQFASGQNPYDWFRGRNVISDTTFQAGGLPAAKSFLGWQFQQLGGGVFYKFYNEPTVPKEQSLAEKAFNLPVLGNIIGRFVRVTDYGKTEKLKAIEKRVGQEKAQETVMERDLINKYVKEAQQKNIKFNTSSIENALVRERYDGRPTTKADVEDAKRLVRKFRISLKRGGADANTIALIDANSNQAKAEILKSIREGMSKEEFSTYRSQLIKDGVVSQTVFEQLQIEDKKQK